MKTSTVAAEAMDRRGSTLTSLLRHLTTRTGVAIFFALCAIIIVLTRWGYAFIVAPHTPIYANFDIGFQYLYADYFRDHGTFPGTPADISRGAANGYFWWWWDNEYFSKYLGLAAAMMGGFMWVGVPFVAAYAMVTWLADMSIAVLAYRLVSVTAGRRAGAIAALLLSVHPLFVWGTYQAQAQISVGSAFFLAVLVCWRWWSDERKPLALGLAALFGLAASLAHAFFLSMLLGAVLPAIVIHTLIFRRTRQDLVHQAAFAAIVTIGLFANTRFWLNLDTYSEATRALIGRTDGWGQLASPLFLLGLTSRTQNWTFGPSWFLLGGFLAVVAFAGIRSLLARDVDANRRAVAVVVSIIFLFDLVYMIGAHLIQYDYWILRHAQFHIIAGVVPASIGLGWLTESARIARRAGAWALAATLTAVCCAVSVGQLFEPRSHGPAFAQFIADERRPKLPYMVLAYPGGTALTPFACALTETPTYDLHPDTIPSLVSHLEGHYGWKPGDEINVLWYSAASQISREDMHFTQILGEWSTPTESVVLGKARLNLGHGALPYTAQRHGWTLVDRIDFGDPASMQAHHYHVDAPMFRGSAALYRQEDQTIHVRTGRATKSYEEFRMKVAPGNEHTLIKVFDTVSTGQLARVTIDGTITLLWQAGNGSSRYAEGSLSIPADITERKHEISLRIDYVAGSLGINSYGYWMFSKPTTGIAEPLMTDIEGYEKADRLDVGDASDESAHAYEIIEPTYTGEQVFTPSEQGASYIETGRATKGAERFRMRAKPGREHLLIKVYDNFSRDQRLRVAVDGAVVGVWKLPTRGERYGEAAFVIPGSFVRSERVLIDVKLMSASLDQNSFVYWLYSGPDNAEHARSAESERTSESHAVQALRPRVAPL